MIRATNISRGKIINKSLVFIDPSDIPQGKDAILEAGEIIVVRSGAYTADSAIVTEDYAGAVVGYDMVVTPKNIEPAFLQWCLLSPYVLKDQLIASSMRAAQPHLNAEELGATELLLPPLKEQTQIARYLDWKTAQIDRFIRNKRRLIELLKEQKQALINQAVTGAIDVRTGKPYPGYKDSSVPWLGKMPSGWSVRKLKYIGDMQSGDNLTSEEIQVSGIYPVYGGNGQRGYYHEYNRDGHFLLIGRQGALCGNVHRVDGRFWATEHAVVVKPRNEIDRDWYYYMLIVMNLNQYSESAAQPGISVEKIQNLVTTVPKMGEQKAIAKYLNQVASAIENTIIRTQREIDLMQEYRTRLITDVVTGKLDVRGIEIPDSVDEGATAEGGSTGVFKEAVV